jgi:cold shock protein
MADESGNVGTVKKWFDEKGFGFITPKDGAPDIFVHFTGIHDRRGGRRQLVEGETVTYGVEESEKGPRAVDVVRQN